MTTERAHSPSIRLYCWLYIYFTTCSTVSVVDFEHVFIWWCFLDGAMDDIKVLFNSIIQTWDNKACYERWDIKECYALMEWKNQITLAGENIKILPLFFFTF